MSHDRMIGSPPTDKQQIMHTCPAIDLVYGGAAGGGKTHGNLAELITECVSVPGSNTIFLRRELDQLAQTIAKSRVILGPYPELCTYNENNKAWKFAPRVNPWCPERLTYQSTLLFDSIPTEGKKESHQGPEYDLIGTDESTHFPPSIISFMQTRSRSAIPGPGPKGLNIARMRHGTNPGSIGHLYFMNEFVMPKYQDVEAVAYWDATFKVWRRFPAGATISQVPETEAPGYDPHLGQEQEQTLYYWRRTDITDNKLYPYAVWYPPLTEADIRENQRRMAEGLDPEPRRSRCFIQAFLRDNPTYYHDGSYGQTLRNNPDKNIVLAQYYGRWDVFEGQFFAFDPRIHVIDPIQPPNHWPIWGSLDYATGKTGYLAAGWHTKNPNTKQIITFREYYVRGDAVTDQQACREIISLSQGEYVMYWGADPSMWQGASRPGAISAAEFWRDQGLNLQPAVNDRASGWNIMKSLMGVDPQTGNPGWVCTRNCHHIQRTLPILTYRKNNEYDLDGEGEDHAADMLRYGLRMNVAHQAVRTEPVKLHTWAGVE